MQINKRYKVESDTLNVTLYHKDAKGNWRSVGFFASPQNALKFLVNHEIMGTGMDDFKTVCQKIEELEGLIKELQGLPERVR